MLRKVGQYHFQCTEEESRPWLELSLGEDGVCSLDRSANWKQSLSPTNHPNRNCIPCRFNFEEAYNEQAKAWDLGMKCISTWQ